ncbi:MAG: YhcH/YjgK/YiaL family protein [Phycisphaerae bacterium]
MVFDQLANCDTYAPLAPRIGAALRFLATQRLAGFPLGRHPLDGEQVFALVQENRTRAMTELRWEAHRRYIDVQCVARGVERLGFSPLEAMRVVQEYDADRDIAFFAGSGEFVTLAPGAFVVLWPQDAHMPGVACGAPADVRKIVIKVAVGA